MIRSTPLESWEIGLEEPVRTTRIDARREGLPGNVAVPKRKITTALLGKGVVRKGKGLSVAERIERPDAPDGGNRTTHLDGI